MESFSSDSISFFGMGLINKYRGGGGVISSVLVLAKGLSQAVLIYTHIGDGSSY